MFCAQCGKSVSNEAKFCSSCGSVVDSSPAASQKIGAVSGRDNSSAAASAKQSNPLSGQSLVTEFRAAKPWQRLFLIFAFVVGGGYGVYYLLFEVKITDSEPKIVANASEIIKKSLRSPSSFSLVSGKEVWSGKNTEGNAAYIVRIEYDAQNGFGATLRDCRLVAYSVKGDQIEWKNFGATEPCKSGVVYDETKWIEVIKTLNFGK